MIIFLGGSSPLVSKEGDIFDGVEKKWGMVFFGGNNYLYFTYFVKYLRGLKV